MKGRKEKTLGENCKLALSLEADVKSKAAEAGLRLRYSIVTGKKTRPTLHWMFDDLETGRRVLNYWPGNGTYTDREMKRKGTARDPWEALEMAKRYGSEASDYVI